MADEHKNTILILNSGSSSLKFGLFAPGYEDEEQLLSGSAEGIGRESGSLRIRAADGTVLREQSPVLESQPDALRSLAAALDEHLRTSPVAIGHRIVHGGPHLRNHQLLTPSVLDQLAAAEHFAPLHIPLALTLVKQAQEIFPQIPHFACFDTAFHNTMPEVATHLPLPQRYFEQGVMRFGFHGLSYESIVHRLGTAVPERAVFAHLGNGSSVTAVRNGLSIDTSMGLTPTGGVPMGTRTGDLDPGVLLYLMRSEGLGVDALEALVDRESGLFGLSKGESDMHQLLQRVAARDAAAVLALEGFCIAVRKFIASYAALMGGLDLLVFTGGIGEHSAEVREKICAGLSFLGLDLGDRDGKLMVMRAEEELQMARHCRRLLGTLSASGAGVEEE
ncbi:acetate/propionate family kinase [Granulicella cerasi]|uniref:Acetate kinase n=1 Tax=Granulicella cerasi TaxID=741063 RepID=A0ABW1ZEE0_9BACT|nr:acetate/propionate family kinase [Granulicella cerasi]